MEIKYDDDDWAATIISELKYGMLISYNTTTDQMSRSNLKRSAIGAACRLV